MIIREINKKRGGDVFKKFEREDVIIGIQNGIDAVKGALKALASADIDNDELDEFLAIVGWLHGALYELSNARDTIDVMPCEDA